MNVGERVERDGRRGTVIRLADPTTLLVAWDDGAKESTQASAVARVGAMIHMTATEAYLPGAWYAFCRCEWASETYPTREQARTAGDQHLAEANR